MHMYNPRSRASGDIFQEMGMEDWHKSGSRSLRLGRDCSRADQESHFWTKFWRKIKREKIMRKIKREKKRNNSNSPVLSYDQETYLQNFDDEARWVDQPDILRRSFSARFADPSGSFHRNVLVD